MAKPAKPQWATNNPTQVIEPTLAKKQTGWLPGEKPPNQFFNWLLLKAYEWINWFESKTENVEPVLIRSNNPIGWDGNTVTFTADIDLIFRVESGPSQINRFTAGNLTLADGDVVVVKRDKFGASPITLGSGTYGSLTDGQYAIVAESSLTPADVENEMILFRRRGSELEIPYLGVVIPINGSYHIGISDDHGILEGLGDDDHPQYLHLNKPAQTILQSVAVAGGSTIDGVDLSTHVHSGGPGDAPQVDHGTLLGLGDDDHAQYILVSGVRAFTGPQSMGGNKITNLQNPTAAQDAATKSYVDSSIITDHGALSGLGDDDHTQYILASGARAFSGQQSMGGNKLVNVANPTAAQDAATKAYVDSSIISDHGALSGLGDDDHPQYLHLNKAGQTLQQNLNVAGGVTIDGVNISLHTHNLTGHTTLHFGQFAQNTTQSNSATLTNTSNSQPLWAVTQLRMIAGGFDSSGTNEVRIGGPPGTLSGRVVSSKPNSSGGNWNFNFFLSANSGGDHFSCSYMYGRLDGTTGGPV